MLGSIFIFPVAELNGLAGEGWEWARRFRLYSFPGREQKKKSRFLCIQHEDEVAHSLRQATFSSMRRMKKISVVAKGRNVGARVGEDGLIGE